MTVFLLLIDGWTQSVWAKQKDAEDAALAEAKSYREFPASMKAFEQYSGHASYRVTFPKTRTFVVVPMLVREPEGEEG